MDGEISRWKFKKKHDISIVKKYLSQVIYYKGENSNFILEKPGRYHFKWWRLRHQ